MSCGFNSDSIPNQSGHPDPPNPIFLLPKRYNQKYKAEEPFPGHDLPLPSLGSSLPNCQIAISWLRPLLVGLTKPEQGKFPS